MNPEWNLEQTSNMHAHAEYRISIVKFECISNFKILIFESEFLHNIEHVFWTWSNGQRYSESNR